jgi:hypothetical protein
MTDRRRDHAQTIAILRQTAEAARRARALALRLGEAGIAAREARQIADLEGRIRALEDQWNIVEEHRRAFAERRAQRRPEEQGGDASAPPDAPLDKGVDVCRLYVPVDPPAPDHPV